MMMVQISWTVGTHVGHLTVTAVVHVVILRLCSSKLTTLESTQNDSNLHHLPHPVFV